MAYCIYVCSSTKSGAHITKILWKIVLSPADSKTGFWTFAKIYLSVAAKGQNKISYLDQSTIIYISSIKSIK